MSLGILRVIGIIVFLYLLWRNLRDNYDEKKIISYSWLGLLGFLIVGRLAFGIFNWGVWRGDWWNWLAVWDKPGMSYLGGYVGLIGVTWFYSQRQNWKFLAFMDDVFRPFLVLVWFLILDEWWRSKLDFKVLAYFLILVIVYVVSRLIDKKYRSFSWYKSGKKGFVWLFSNFLFFLLLMVDLLCFRGSWLQIGLTFGLSLVSILGLFVLGRIKNERK